METPFAAHQDILETFLQWGMSPTAFIKRAHVTLLGYAAYAQRLDLEFPPYLCSTVPFSVSEVIVDEINASLA